MREREGRGAYINRVRVRMNCDGWRVGLGGKWAGASCKMWALFFSLPITLLLLISLSVFCLFWRRNRGKGIGL